jgi:hypothetical protein
MFQAGKEKMKKVKTLFDKAKFSKRDFQTTTLVLAVVVAVSSDAETKLKCDSALKGLRRLSRVVNKRVKTKRSLRKRRR